MIFLYALHSKIKYWIMVLENDLFPECAQVVYQKLKESFSIISESAVGVGSWGTVFHHIHNPCSGRIVSKRSTNPI